MALLLIIVSDDESKYNINVVIECQGVGQISPNGRTIPPAPMHVRVPFHFNPVRELEWMIRALGIF
ncbi:MAG: hypothetical protein RXS42_05900, partial [Nitrososphaeria archaeon]